MQTQTLVSFCPHCFKAGQPHIGKKFVVYGRHRKCFHIYTAEYKGIIGYTPHIVQLVKIIGGKDVVYNQACGICGVNIWQSADKVWCFSIKTWERRILELEHWNAWIQYHTDNDYFI